MKKLIKDSDILFVFDDLKDKLKNAEINLSLLPALINRFLFLVLKEIESLSKTNIFLNHIHTEINYKFENSQSPIIIILYLHFDYVPKASGVAIEKIIKKHLSTFKFRDYKIKFIKEEGVYIEFTKNLQWD